MNLYYSFGPCHLLKGKLLGRGRGPSHGAKLQARLGVRRGGGVRGKRRWAVGRRGTRSEGD